MSKYTHSLSHTHTHTRTCCTDRATHRCRDLSSQTKKTTDRCRKSSFDFLGTSLFFASYVSISVSVHVCVSMCVLGSRQHWCCLSRKGHFLVCHSDRSPNGQLKINFERFSVLSGVLCKPRLPAESKLSLSERTETHIMSLLWPHYISRADGFYCFSVTLVFKMCPTTPLGGFKDSPVIDVLIK